MPNTQLYAPNKLPIVGALTVEGTVAKLLQFWQEGSRTDYEFELQDYAIVSPTVLVDSEGGKWEPIEAEFATLTGRYTSAST